MGSHPLLPPGKLSPSLSSAPDGLTSPLFPAASVSLFLFRSFPFLLLLFPARLPKSSLSLFHARARDEGWRCFFFLSVFIRYMRFDSLGSPSGRKVFERDPRASRFRDSGKEKFREFSRIEHFWNRFFRKVSFDWGLWDWRCTGFSRIKYNSKGKIGVDI